VHDEFPTALLRVQQDDAQGAFPSISYLSIKIAGQDVLFFAVRWRGEHASSIEKREKD